MRLLVTGSRIWDDADYIRRVLDGLFNDHPFGFVLHHGACPTGADAIADAWAVQMRRDGADLLVVRHPARWRDDQGGFDRRAGFRRNAEMVTDVVHADVAQTAVCHAFIRDRSGGATHCANLAAKAGIPVIRHRWEDR